MLPSLLGQKGLLNLVIPGCIAHEVWHSTCTLTERVLFQNVETDPIAERCACCFTDLMCFSVEFPPRRYLSLSEDQALYSKMSL